MQLVSMLVLVLVLVAGIGTGARWLRIAQREHYIAGSTTRFAIRWWGCRASNIALGVAAFITAAGSLSYWPLAIVVVIISGAAPIGLSMRGRSARLSWTRRLRSAALVAGLLYIAVCLTLFAAGEQLIAAMTLAPILAPLIVDVALAILGPVERRIGKKYVVSAARRLREVGPRVLAITGSYGKTTTKEYLRHLTSTSLSVVASPASFNNQAGLSKCINELLSPGTELFIAEVGTYKPGEIREICRWLKPNIGIITAIGPVHLERMRTIETIVRAKSELLEMADVAVLNVDFPQLNSLSDSLTGSHRVVRCTAESTDCDVLVRPHEDKLTVVAGDTVLATIQRNGVHPGNLACAVAAALEVGVPHERIRRQLETLPSPAHRQEVVTNARGITVIDNTYNSNPDAARSSIQLLANYGSTGRRIVVSPGIVELGTLQQRENEAFARAASTVATDFVVVGQTNRRSLVRGLCAGDVRQRLVNTRQEAVNWVRGAATDGDVVLYENDLPDHYP